MDWDKVSAELSRKLDPSAVKPAKQYGPKGDYIEGWHAMAEANRIFGFDGWDYAISDCKCVSDRPKKIGKDGKDGFAVSYIATVQVFVGSVHRQDVGSGHGYDLDCGLAHESAIKEAVTDALKRALRSFGNPFGLALYDKSRENVGYDAPAFDPVAAHDRIVKNIEAAKDYDHLTEVWGDSKETVLQIAETRKDLGTNCYAARDKRKAELAPKGDADAKP